MQKDGGNVLPVLMVEACSTKYSKPILNDDYGALPVDPDAVQGLGLQEERRQGLHRHHERRPDGQDVRPAGGRGHGPRGRRPEEVRGVRPEQAGAEDDRRRRLAVKARAVPAVAAAVAADLSATSRIQLPSRRIANA
ncbi:MAG: hypothetical protein MZW92_46420 [Comamonadaceae bacterium]|nr:hypothetical protein [Comamonadaceae bacterium]